MSKDWSEGYFTDIGYTYGYYRELSPVFIRFCLLLRGIDAPDPADFTYCELGIGQGMSVTIHSATNAGRYWGTDFNPEQAAFADGLVRGAGLNAKISDHSFEEFLQADLPPMDFITLHGIWTWVSKENQQQIVAFARKFLKPGGVLYVSYNTYPGWSMGAPLRQLFALHDRFGGKAQGALTRVDSAIAFSEKVLGCDSPFKRAIPGIEGRLQKIKEQNRNYVAHEYFNREWNVMYFADVAEQLSEAKLEFASSAHPLDNIDAIQLSEGAQQMMKQIEHPILREQMRDYFTFAQFRRDLYTRGARRLGNYEKSQRLLDMRFALMTPPEDIPKKVSGAQLEGNLQPEVYEPVINALADRQFEAKSLRSICAAVHGAGLAADRVLQAITVLVGMGHVAPCQSEEAAKRVKASTDSLNAEILRRSVFGKEISYMASPLLGGAVGVNRVQQLFLLSKVLKHADPVAFAWQVFKDNNERLAKEGKPLETEEDNLAELRRTFESFSQKAVPMLKALQVIR